MFAFVLLLLLAFLLWVIIADREAIDRFGVVADALSAFTIALLTVLLFRVELGRDRAKFSVDEVMIHSPPQDHEPDQFTIGFRLINTGGRDSVIWQRKSHVRAYDRFGSPIPLDTSFWPFRGSSTAEHTRGPQAAPQDHVVAPGTMKDFVAQVQLPNGIDAAGTKLELVVTPAIGPTVRRAFESKRLQEWLNVVRKRHPWPPP